MNHGLEKAVAKANRILVRHRILLGVDDRGKLSCHKTNLCFIYFDTTDCVVSLIDFNQLVGSMAIFIVIIIIIINIIIIDW